MVVIDLTADENAQEIFETLNARGAQLTAADLIKNFIFQRLTESGVDVEAAYEQYWKEFETGFWETEISAGRLRHQRSSMFLNHWLIAKTGEEILAREVFHRFKTYADFDSGVSMIELLDSSTTPARCTETSSALPDSSLALSTGWGCSPTAPALWKAKPSSHSYCSCSTRTRPRFPADQLTKALEVVESWLVRRMLVRATTKSYAQVFAELITHVRKTGRQSAGDVIEDYLEHQPGTNSYWPDNDEVRAELRTLAAYRRLSRARLRMVLEAIEDHERGWRGPATGLGGERVARGKYAIEHVMPRRWQAHWALAEGQTAADRDPFIDTIGNLTLLTGRLNSKVSNGPWSGPDGKYDALHSHDVLMLNRRLLEQAKDGWDDERIRARTEQLVDVITEVWPVPEGHKSRTERIERRPMRKVELADLMAAGLLEEGATLYARRRRVAERTATVLSDGTLDVDGVRYSTPSGASRAVSGTNENGWWFWLVDPKSKRSLHDLWREYVDQRDVDVEDDDPPDDEDEGLTAPFLPGYGDLATTSATSSKIAESLPLKLALGSRTAD